MGFKKNDPCTIQRSSHRKRLTCFLIVSTKVGTDQITVFFECVNKLLDKKNTTC